MWLPSVSSHPCRVIAENDFSCCGNEPERQRGPTHREEVTEGYVREDLVSPVLRALPPALSPELLELLQQGPRGAEEKGVLLGDGVIQRRVIAVTAQPATESGHCHLCPHSLSPGGTK